MAASLATALSAEDDGLAAAGHARTPEGTRRVVVPWSDHFFRGHEEEVGRAAAEFILRPPDGWPPSHAECLSSRFQRQAGGEALAEHQAFLLFLQGRAIADELQRAGSRAATLEPRDHRGPQFR